MNSKPVLTVVASGLLGLVLAGCEPTGPQDLKLTAPPGAVSPQVSDTAKTRRLTYTIAQSQVARAHAVEELLAQGFIRCPNAESITWSQLVVARDGKRVNTVRLQEMLFLHKPPRLASLDMVRVPEGVAVTVELEQTLTGEIVDTKRARFCSGIGN